MAFVLGHNVNLTVRGASSFDNSNVKRYEVAIELFFL